MNRFAALLLLVLAGCGRPDDGNVPTPTAAPPPPADSGIDEGQKERSKDPGRIAFVKNGSSLWTMKPDGSDAKQVVKGDGSWLGHPAWSPNRKWIAFSSEARANRNLYHRNLFIVKADGTDLKQVTPMVNSGAVLSGPQARVTGRAVLSLPKGRLGIENFEVCAYGTDQIAKTAVAGKFAIALPVGVTWIKISGLHEGVRYSGSIMQAFKADETVDVGDVPLTIGGADSEAIHPAWSPEGKRLYFIMVTPNGGADPTTAVWRIALDGGAAERRLWDKELHFDGPLGIDIPKHQLFARTRNAEGTRAFVIDLATWRVEDQKDLGFCAAEVGMRGVEVRLDQNLTQELWRGTKLLSLEPSKGSFRATDESPDGAKLVVEIRTPDGKSDLWESGKALTTDGVSGDPAWNGR